MNGDVVYLDSSAFLKLVVPEPNSAALQSYLAARPRRVSAMLLKTEVLRASLRVRVTPLRMLLLNELFATVNLIPADDSLSDEAGRLQPPELRSLDAIHLATARIFGPRLEAVVTYDLRLAAAAAWYGLTVVSPGN